MPFMMGVAGQPLHAGQGREVPVVEILEAGGVSGDDLQELVGVAAELSERAAPGARR